MGLSLSAAVAAGGKSAVPSAVCCFAGVMLFAGAEVGMRMGMNELEVNVGLGGRVCWIATGVGLKQLDWRLLL